MNYFLVVEQVYLTFGQQKNFTPLEILLQNHNMLQKSKFPIQKIPSQTTKMKAETYFHETTKPSSKQASFTAFGALAPCFNFQKYSSTFHDGKISY